MGRVCLLEDFVCVLEEMCLAEALVLFFENVRKLGRRNSYLDSGGDMGLAGHGSLGTFICRAFFRALPTRGWPEHMWLPGGPPHSPSPPPPRGSLVLTYCQALVLSPQESAF